MSIIAVETFVRQPDGVDVKYDEPREEWGYTTPIAQFFGPDFPEAGAIAGEHPLDTGIHPSGPTLYLLARTLEAFARCISQYDIPLPVYFSCIYAVFRLNVPARFSRERIQRSPSPG